MKEETPFPYELIEIARREGQYLHYGMIDNNNNVLSFPKLRLTSIQIKPLARKFKIPDIEKWSIDIAQDFVSQSDVGLDLKILEQFKEEIDNEKLDRINDFNGYNQTGINL